MVNKRKQPRVSIRHAGAIYQNGSLLGQCTIVDVSADGARVLLREEMKVPLKFTLSMAQNGTVQRRCETMWQAEMEIGVRFIG